MYLWKYWRESRIALVIAALAVVMLAVLTFKGHEGAIENPHAYAGVVFVLQFVTAASVGLFAWGMGSFGAGRSLGEGAGAFLLTRPRRRSWFLWRDWGAGLTFVAIFLVLLSMLEGVGVSRGLAAADAPVKQILLHGGEDSASLIECLGLNAIAAFLFCGLVFGIVYLMTIVLKNALGIVVGGGVLAGYVIASALLHHYTGHALPALLQLVYAPPSNNSPTVFTHALGVSMTVRAGVVLLFPVAAQMVLERSDI